MKKAGSAFPADPTDVLMAAGAASLCADITILSKAQALRFFRSAYMEATAAERQAREAWNEWLDGQARDQAPPPPPPPPPPRPPKSPKHLRTLSPPEVLGVSVKASRKEINAAWRALANRWHPDKPGGDAVRMAEINAARDNMLRTCSA